LEDNSKIFCLGDSRTGTQSLHFYFQNNGIKSIHYYVRDAGASEPLHENIEGNKIATLNFVRDSGYSAFTDYPTRFFWKELAEAYPSAYFILTTRKNHETWLKSAVSFFSKFNITVDYEELAYFHEHGNSEIREYFQKNGFKFIEICIDDSNELNSQKLASFLSFDASIKIPHENATNKVNMNKISAKATVWGGAPLSIAQISSMIHSGKALLGEYGWLYLANDSNDFMRYQFGEIVWTQDEIASAQSVMADRISKIEGAQSKYLKFIIPEKTVIYKEFLPKAIAHYQNNDNRPARIMANSFKKHVYYLEEYLEDAKSYGNIYFRGDSHPNWIGGYLIYRYIMERLDLLKISNSSLLDLKDLTPLMARYEGDLYGQLEDKQKTIFQKEWGYLLPDNGFELVTKLDIPPKVARAQKISADQNPEYNFGKRETFVYESANKNLPTAVIFRDSTFDFVHELLAQHFSRSVFIWHEGAVIWDVIEKEKPDIVIHGMAERFVSTYPKFQPTINLKVKAL